MARLDKLIEQAAVLARAAKAINDLRRGKDGPAAAALATAIEQETRRIIAATVRRRRRSRRQGRDTAGTFRRL